MYVIPGDPVPESYTHCLVRQCYTSKLGCTPSPRSSEMREQSRMLAEFINRIQDVHSIIPRVSSEYQWHLKVELGTRTVGGDGGICCD